MTRISVKCYSEIPYKAIRKAHDTRRRLLVDEWVDGVPYKVSYTRVAFEMSGHIHSVIHQQYNHIPRLETYIARKIVDKINFYYCIPKDELYKILELRGE